jgi:phage-related protein
MGNNQFVLLHQFRKKTIKTWNNYKGYVKAISPEERQNVD